MAFKKEWSRKRLRNPMEDKENVPMTHKKQMSNSCRSQGTPVYCSQVLREQNWSVGEKGKTIVIDNDPDPEPLGSSKSCFHISEFQVYECDLNLLRSNSEWLNDTIINYMWSTRCCSLRNTIISARNKAVYSSVKLPR